MLNADSSLCTAAAAAIIKTLLSQTTVLLQCDSLWKSDYNYNFTICSSTNARFPIRAWFLQLLPHVTPQCSPATGSFPFSAYICYIWLSLKLQGENLFRFVIHSLRSHLSAIDELSRKKKQHNLRFLVFLIVLVCLFVFFPKLGVKLIKVKVGQDNWPLQTRNWHFSISGRLRIMRTFPKCWTGFAEIHASYGVAVGRGALKMLLNHRAEC